MQLPIQEVDFERHMREKARMWRPFTLFIGKDFAVFEFDNKDLRKVAIGGLTHYAASYGYTFSEGPREQLSIVKGEIT
jgi:hypothetical protein